MSDSQKPAETTEDLAVTEAVRVPESEADGAPVAGANTPTSQPSFVFFGVVAALVLIADAVTKAWAETTLSRLPRNAPNIVLIEDRLTFSLAYNTGGAFGMLSDESAVWRKPFFMLVSVGAVVFIISLYRKVSPKQWALKWGLPLVLGGALGNLVDRITKGKVVDFIDYRAAWVRTMNELIHSINSDWHVTRHWPTFNVADMCICVGVGLMAIDMFMSSRASTSNPPLDTASTSNASR
jgi:signal peptidase II